MKENGMYFGKSDIYQKIKDIGGQWNDSKDRPIVCLIDSSEMKGLYWAIPVGSWNHRNEKAQERINKYLQYPDNDLRSCYYHIGKTTVKSIFFISDVIPITSFYIDRDYVGFDKKQYVIKNKKLIKELEYKLKRVLAFENNNNNYFRQRITDIKNILIEELNEKVKKINNKKVY